MPKLSAVEKRIFDREGFEVEFKKDGRDVRGDLVLPKQYEAKRMTWNSFSVSDFREKVKYQFPGYDIDVLKADGTVASGQTKLYTVRDTYLNDDEN